GGGGGVSRGGRGPGRRVGAGGGRGALRRERRGAKRLGARQLLGVARLRRDVAILGVVAGRAQAIARLPVRLPDVEQEQRRGDQIVRLAPRLDREPPLAGVVVAQAVLVERGGAIGRAAGLGLAARRRAQRGDGRDD